MRDKITEDIKIVARDERRDPEFIKRGLALGTIAILKNPIHSNCHPVGIGEGLARDNPGLVVVAVAQITHALDRGDAFFGHPV